MYKDRVELIEADDQLQPLLFVHKEFEKTISNTQKRHFWVGGGWFWQTFINKFRSCAISFERLRYLIRKVQNTHTILIKRVFNYCYTSGIFKMKKYWDWKDYCIASSLYMVKYHLHLIPQMSKQFYFMLIFLIIEVCNNFFFQPLFSFRMF